jgi:hypothetical protein
MFRNKERDDGVSFLIDDVVRAGGIGEGESDSVASSPLLFARVCDRIARDRTAAQELDRDEASAAGWMLTLLVARRAIPALALLAVISMIALWAASKDRIEPSGASDPEFAVKQVAIGGTCALSNTAECAISNEEVLATMFGNGEVPK